MKSYYAPDQLRLVGKGWEVRHYLRKLRQPQPELRHAPGTLAELLASPDRQRRPNAKNQASAAPFRP